MRWPGRPSVREEVHALNELLGSDRRHKIHEQARGTELVHTLELHIFKEYSEFFKQ